MKCLMCGCVFLLSTFQGYKIQSTKSFNSSKNIFKHFPIQTLYVYTSIIYINNIHVRVYFTAYKDTAIQNRIEIEPPHPNIYF